VGSNPTGPTISTTLFFFIAEVEETRTYLGRGPSCKVGILAYEVHPCHGFPRERSGQAVACLILIPELLSS